MSMRQRLDAQQARNLARLRRQLTAHSYPFPNDFGKPLDACLALDLEQVRWYVRYAHEDARTQLALRLTHD